MIYLKSVLVGLLALIVVPVCLLVILMSVTLIYALVHPTSGEGSIGWDRFDLDNPPPVTDIEDEETLAAIDEGIRAPEAGRTVPAKEVNCLLEKF
jgi:hypothetical protein